MVVYEVREGEGLMNTTGVVLVVEDDAPIREVMKEELESMGLEVLSASSGEEALMFLETRRVDVVVMDLRMPGMDGVETAIVIKKGFPDLPIILCTVCDERHVRSFLGREIQAYLRKPFTLRQLNDTVVTALAAVRQFNLVKDPGGDSVRKNSPALVQSALEWVGRKNPDNPRRTIAYLLVLIRKMGADQ